MNIHDIRQNALAFAERKLGAIAPLENVIALANDVVNWVMTGRLQAETPDRDGPVEFIERWFSLQHPIKGATPAVLHDFQRKMITTYGQHRQVVVNHSRLMGFSTFSALYFLHLALVKPGSTFFLLTPRTANAEALMERITFSVDRCRFNSVVPVFRNKSCINFSNDSRIVSRRLDHRVSDHFKGEPPTALFIDQAAYVSHNLFRMFWADAMPYLSDTKIVIGSDPGVSEGLFYELWQGAPANGFEPLELPWHLHPDRDENWAASTRQNTGSDGFEQGFCCKFKKA